MGQDPFVPACSPLAYGHDTSLDELLNPMGVSGGIAPAPMSPSTLAWQAMLQQAQQALSQQAQPNWPSKAAQQWMASQQNVGMLGGAGAGWQQAATHLVQVIPLEEVGRQKIHLLLTQLPMRVMENITSIRLYEDPLRFVITYKTGHVLEVNDVDKFPAAEHISRILLESS